MKVEALLKTVLVMLAVALAVVLTSWVAGERHDARAQGGGGAKADEWMMVASTLRAGEGLIYMFNTQKQVLLVYAYHHGRSGGRRNNFDGDLQFIAGRHCTWDLLYSQQRPFPAGAPPKGLLTPRQVKDEYDKLLKEQERAAKKK